MFSLRIMMIIILSILLTSCVEKKDLNANEIAIVNGDIITVEDVEKKLTAFELEKSLYEYNRFRNNIYPNLELLHLRHDLIDHVVDLLRSANIEDARSFISSLKGYENGEALKYFLLKEFDRYEKIINKQNNMIYAFEETLKDVILSQEAKAKSLIPSQSELEKAHEEYLLNIQEKIDANIHYEYFHAFKQSKEKALFHLDTEEAYQSYTLEKVKHNLVMKRLKEEIGSYQLDRSIKNRLKESNIIVNKKYSNYKNYFSH